MKGAGSRAVAKSLKQSGLWGLLTVLMQFGAYYTHVAWYISWSLQAGWQIALLVFYGRILLTSPAKLFRRPALTRYALYWVVLYLFYSVQVPRATSLAVAF